jgi:hypothetical protein
MAERVLHTHEEAQAIYRTLKQEFGLSSDQFNQIAANRGTYTDDRIQQAIERTRFSLRLGKVTKSPAGFFMKALKEGWVVSDAERQMIDVQQTLALTEQRASEAKEKAQSMVAVQTAAHEITVRNRMREEARVGRELFDQADRKQKDEWLRSYLSSQAGKLTLKRLKIAPTTVDEAVALRDPDLAGDFARFVFNKTRPKSVTAG